MGFLLVNLEMYLMSVADPRLLPEAALRYRRASCATVSSLICGAFSSSGAVHASTTPFASKARSSELENSFESSKSCMGQVT